MAVSLLIPTALRQFTEGRSEVSIEAASVGGVLESLTTTYPDLQRHLFSGPGQLRSFVNVYVGEKDIRSLSGLDTTVGPGDTVILVPAIAGGSRG